MKDYRAPTKRWELIMQSIKPLDCFLGIEVYLFAVGPVCKAVLTIELACFGCF
jgi:hypothetical protein